VYWVLGMVLAWVYMSTKDLRYSILVHMCYNALGFI
ncbi:MAG: CPBP family glutamic-type intramembrane protease, partial [Lactobacillus crispatus]|nr:CPBP family glutamic-type intramembrane protease [Lactobacillus crispatus]